jgi:hypothetical protein
MGDFSLCGRPERPGQPGSGASCGATRGPASSCSTRRRHRLIDWELPRRSNIDCAWQRPLPDGVDRIGTVALRRDHRAPPTSRHSYSPIARSSHPMAVRGATATIDSMPRRRGSSMRRCPARRCRRGAPDPPTLPVERPRATPPRLPEHLSRRAGPRPEEYGYLLSGAVGM